MTGGGNHLQVSSLPRVVLEAACQLDSTGLLARTLSCGLCMWPLHVVSPHGLIWAPSQRDGWVPSTSRANRADVQSIVILEP